MEITIREATIEDAKYIGGHLREDDRREVEALGFTPECATVFSYSGSDEAYTGCVDGVPAMIFGIGAPSLADETSVWALGTPLCDRVPLAMVRIGREAVKRFLEKNPVLTNWCDARYTKTIKWLKLLGFTIGDPEPYGNGGALFCKLTIRKED